MSVFGAARLGSGSVTVNVLWRSQRSTGNVAPAAPSYFRFICAGAGTLFLLLQGSTVLQSAMWRNQTWPWHAGKCWSVQQNYSTFILVVSPSVVVEKNQIFNCEKFNHYSFTDDFKWKSWELQSCVTSWDLQLCFWPFLDPRKFKNSNLLCNSNFRGSYKLNFRGGSK